VDCAQDVLDGRLGHHELSNKRGPLTTPEKHNHQPMTNQLVSQPKETWIGNNSTSKGLEGMENVDRLTML